MRKLFILVLVLSSIACKKYKDPAPFTDSRINNPYCNDPSAVNYNWGFPGIPNNALCIYPSSLYAGNYFYRDSLYDDAGNVIAIDSFPITITIVDTTKVKITGFCGANILTAHADKYYKLNIDSTFSAGQHVCNTTDTITGTGSKKGFDDSLSFKLTYLLKTSTSAGIHSGTATKQ